MGMFTEADPELMLLAIEGHKDALTNAAEKQARFYKSFKCPRCKGSLEKEFDHRHVFSDEDCPLPRALLRCPVCKYLIDPYTDVILSFGDASKVPIEQVPFIGGDKG